ncbi:MAG: hypothetical protein HXY28_02995 [Hydrogenophilaceae bacterium]|jgi:hypothetical protein|nr:hypothetical protein [Hydrogenophilaceae bacterium]
MFADIPSDVAGYFKPEMPLGPTKGENIKSSAAAAFLLRLENAAFAGIATRASVLIGRRGAGKSVLLRSFTNSYEIASHVEAYLHEADIRRLIRSQNEFTQKYDIVLTLDKPDEATSVVKEIVQEGLFTPEHAARIWEERLWTHVLRALVLDKKLWPRLQPQRRQLLGLLDKTGLFDRRHQPDLAALIKAAQEEVSTSSLVDFAKDCVHDHDIQILAIIDSMEEYDVQNPAMVRAIGGLLQLVGSLTSPANGSVHIKISLPSEIYPLIAESSNIGKYYINSELIRWQPVELMRILAHRYLTGLHFLNYPAFNDLWIKYNKSLFKDRDRLRAFWDECFGSHLTNEAGHPESAILFILRHTQLLPRQLINFVQALIKRSFDSTGSYERLDPTLLADRELITNAADYIQKEVAFGYKYVYPKTVDVWRMILPRCDVITSYGELQSRYTNSSVRGLGHEYCMAFHNFIRAMVEMGVFGIVVDDHSSDRYIKAAFEYNRGTEIALDEGTKLAMHPVFSARHMTDPAKRAAPGRAILPIGSFDGLEDS